MTGLQFSANLPPQAHFSGFNPVKPQCGLEEKSDKKSADESSKADQDIKDADSFSAQDKKVKAEDVKAEESAFSSPQNTDFDDVEAAHSASKTSGMDDSSFIDEPSPVRNISEQPANQPVKDKKYWIKSILLSAVSLASLVGMVVAMIPGIGIGMLPALGLILGGLLAHDVSSNISRQKGLMNISDVDYLKGVIAERSEPLLQTASRLFHPFSPEKQALFVQQHLRKVQSIDPHRLLNKTGLDYQTMLNDMKSESSVALKAFIIGRFLALFILKRGLGSFMMGRGKIAAWAALGVWGWISQNKHGTLSDLPPQALRPTARPMSTSNRPFMDAPETRAKVNI